MKPLYLAILGLLISNITYSQIVDIPDNNFKQALISVGVDTNGDNQIQVEEAKATESLLIGNRGITDITGIEAFENLKDFGCSGNTITNLSFENNLKLERLWCSAANVRFLELKNNVALRILDCSANNITRLELSDNVLLEKVICEKNDLDIAAVSDLPLLKELDISNNRLLSLSLSNLAALEVLDFASNRISIIDISDLKSLKTLNCGLNNLESLEVVDLTNLEVLSCGSSKLMNLKLENLPLIQEINCQRSSITSLSLVDMPVLKKLQAGYNDISTIELINLTSLEVLGLTTNELISLELNLPKLKDLNIFRNKIESLSLKETPDIEVLNCSYNDISLFEIENNTKLVELDCDYNEIPSLDLRSMIALEKLECRDNQLTSLNLENLEFLTNVVCDDNPEMVELNVTGCKKLNSLRLDDNNALTYIDFHSLPGLKNFSGNNSGLLEADFSKCPLIETINNTGGELREINFRNNLNLRKIYCGQNNLTEIDVTGLLNLETLYCGNNDIEVLDLRNNYLIQDVYTLGSPIAYLYIANGKNDEGVISMSSGLLYICADEEEIDYFRNRFLAQWGLINSMCAFELAGDYYSISGGYYFDEDKNGCDSMERLSLFSKLNISGDLEGSFFTNQNGEFFVPVYEGSYNITPELEGFDNFEVNPNIIVATFPDDGNEIVQDFCMVAKEDIDDLEISIIPITGARPGFQAVYKIKYQNNGTTTLSGDITFGYNSELVEFLSADPLEDVAIPNSIKWFYSELKPFEKGEIIVTLELNSPMDTPALNGGDVLDYKVVIEPRDNDFKSNDNIACLAQDVVNAWDPNDKRCLEGNTIFEELIGEYVHYMIRFENTGSAEAVNISVTDEIDTTKFDLSSLQITDSSHEMRTRVTDGNIVEFIFNDIYLPFEDSTNDGYIVFKIKTLPTLSVGDIFENEANIFFDYNFPIKTNRESTSINLMTSTEENLENNIQVNIYPNPTTDVVNIECKDRISQVSIYNAQGQMVRDVSIIGQSKKLNINLALVTSGVYYLKVETEKGVVLKDIVRK